MFTKNLHILQDSRGRLGGQVEPWQGFCCFQVFQEPPHPPRLQEETWRTGGVLTGFVMLDLNETCTEKSERWSLSYDTSSKTPGRDLEEMWSLDRVSDVGSWWSFHRSFWRMIPIIWHQLQVHQEPPCPPILQDENWWIGWVLTRFLILVQDETFTESSWGYTHPFNTIYKFIRNLLILLDSKRRLGG